MSKHAAPDASSVVITTDSVQLPGSLELPFAPRGIIVFAHGSGSSRSSPRNRYVASILHEAHLGTLLFDLLTEAEAQDRRNVFDIPLLARRLLAAVRWTLANPTTANLGIGLFGASTGAGAALVAAAQEPHVDAVVSRGGRPDLATGWLAKVTAPTLLIVGGDDHEVIRMNTEALEELRCVKKLAIVPGASHLFEETGTLEQVARLARDWFVLHVRSTREP